MRTRCIENYALTTGNHTFDNPIRSFYEIFEEILEAYRINPIERLSEKFIRDSRNNK